jgi:hypothetical protein
MKPPACVSCKWGTGTTCEKQVNSASSKELEIKLKQMAEERLKQDQAWFAPPSNREQISLNTKEGILADKSSKGVLHS